MEKVKISKSLASAIETVRTNGFYDNKNFKILEMATTQPKEDSIMWKEHEVIYLFCHHDGIDILIQALANDYEVEETPEDKVKAQYESPRHFYDKDNDTFTHVYRKGIKFALDTFNIKIEGIN